MNGRDEREIVEWGYWTAKFLFAMSGKIHSGMEPEKRVLGSFLRDHGWTENANFVLDNQATILMTAYVLLVYPRELIDGFDYGTLLGDLQQGFAFTAPTVPPGNKTFIRKMRNAIAHANIELTLGENAHFRLWNETRAGVVDFDVCIFKKDFVEFLARLGEFFVNYVRNQPA